MKYKLLGQSGLRVSELSLGTMGFGTEWKWGADKEKSQQIFRGKRPRVQAGGPEMVKESGGRSSACVGGADTALETRS